MAEEWKNEYDELASVTVKEFFNYTIRKVSCTAAPQWLAKKLKTTNKVE